MAWGAPPDRLFPTKKIKNMGANASAGKDRCVEKGKQVERECISQTRDPVLCHFLGTVEAVHCLQSVSGVNSGDSTSSQRQSGVHEHMKSAPSFASAASSGYMIPASQFDEFLSRQTK